MQQSGQGARMNEMTSSIDRAPADPTPPPSPAVIFEAIVKQLAVAAV